MTKKEIVNRIRCLVNYDVWEIWNAIDALAKEIENSTIEDNMLCGQCTHLCEHYVSGDTSVLYSCYLTGLGTHPTQPCHCFKRRK